VVEKQIIILFKIEKCFYDFCIFAAAACTLLTSTEYWEGWECSVCSEKELEVDFADCIFGLPETELMFMLLGRVVLETITTSSKSSSSFCCAATMLLSEPYNIEFSSCIKTFQRSEAKNITI
jgi:hypothetical protein